MTTNVSHSPRDSGGVADARYVFWLQRPPDGWAAVGLVHCVITAAEVALDTMPPLTIPLDQIRDCVDEAFGSSTGYIIRVRLELLGGNQPLYLRLANPLSPKWPLYRKASETDAFVAVVNGLRKGHVPDVNPNPYLRALAARKKRPPPGITLDADTSPLAYYRIFNPKVPWWQIVFWVLGTLLALVFIVAIIALIFNGVGT